jgi:hypothetical protein
VEVELVEAAARLEVGDSAAEVTLVVDLAVAIPAVDLAAAVVAVTPAAVAGTAAVVNPRFDCRQNTPPLGAALL